ncbi:MAG TPA: hypothetical protein DDX91_02920 [Ruminococcaceae bacterium]|nr:hypothetical protein [Oscillospiraceae bacterium]
MNEKLNKPSALDADDGNILVLVNRNNLISRSYTPVDMVAVQGTERLIKRSAHIAYLKMKADALAEGLDFYIDSAYRSYSTQERLFIAGGGERSKVCAPPGASEHHTGLAVDILTLTLKKGPYRRFFQTPEYRWLCDHCADYGFIIRYPYGKTHITGYDWEPWHFRYVGRETAAEITKRKITLEEYLNDA